VQKYNNLVRQTTFKRIFATDKEHRIPLYSSR